MILISCCLFKVFNLDNAYLNSPKQLKKEQMFLKLISNARHWCRVSPILNMLFPLFCVVTKLYSFALIIDIGLILFNIDKGIKVDIRDIELINKLLLIISFKSNLIKFKFNTI